MRFLDEHDVRSVFDIDTAIASQRTAFIALAQLDIGRHAD